MYTTLFSQMKRLFSRFKPMTFMSQGSNLIIALRLDLRNKIQSTRQIQLHEQLTIIMEIFMNKKDHNSLPG